MNEPESVLQQLERVIDQTHDLQTELPRLHRAVLDEPATNSTTRDMEVRGVACSVARRFGLGSEGNAL